jgi:hypothetical protein
MVSGHGYGRGNQDLNQNQAVGKKAVGKGPTLRIPDFSKTSTYLINKQDILINPIFVPYLEAADGDC